MNWSEEYQITPIFRKPAIKPTNHYNNPQQSSKYYHTPLTYPHQPPKSKKQTYDTSYQHSNERSGSRPKLEYLRFEKQQPLKQNSPSRPLNGKQEHPIFKIEKQQSQFWKLKKEPPETSQKISLFVHQDYQIKTKNSNIQAPKSLYCHPNNNQSIKQPSNKFFEITFSLGSTQPEQSEKEENQQRTSTLFHHLKNKQAQLKRSKQRHSQVPLFRRKIIQRQIHSKEQEYRSLIRSSSKECGKIKNQITSKMKTVLDQLFILKKQLPN